MYQGRRKEKEVDNGFIYPTLNTVIHWVEALNLVNLFKFFAIQGTRRFNKNLSNVALERLIRRNRNIAVDVFIVFKFLVVVFLWIFNINIPIITSFVVYLLFMNSFTYFYYHVWEESAILNQYLTVHRVRRRFISLTSSIAYMVFTYGYLYCVPFATQYNWGSQYPSYIKALLFSISNSFNGGYNGVTPSTELGEIIKAIQIVFVFVFIAIILARSIPQGNSK
jgi:hypothetical protein